MAKTVLQGTVTGARRGERQDKMGRYQRMDRNGVWRLPEGSGRQGRVERYCRNDIGGAATTAEVKGLR